MNKTRVALVYPRGGDVKQGIPLAFGYLKSNADSNRYDIRIIDCTLDDIDPKSRDFAKRIVDINPDVVGVTSWSCNFSEALTVLKVVKQINPCIVTVFGGPHATVCATDVIVNKEINFVFRGEAERSFPLFLDELKKETYDFSKIEGLVYRNENGDPIINQIAIVENLDEVKTPDYDSIGLERYIKKGYRYQNTRKKCVPWATRGCPYQCAFCAVPKVSGRKVRKHSIEYLIRWIKLLYDDCDVRGFVIIDDNFTFDVEYAKAFCREVIRLGYDDIEFNSPNGVRMQRGDSELWGLMRLAGWRTVVVAPESGSKRVLQRLRKDLDPEIVPGIVADIRKAGLKVHGFFVIGFPEETREDLAETESLIRRCGFDELSITLFQPMPGSPIYDELVEQGDIPADFRPGLFGNHRSGAYIPRALKGFDFEDFKLRLGSIAFVNLLDLRAQLRVVSCVGWKFRGEILRHPLFVARVLFGMVKSWVRHPR